MPLLFKLSHGLLGTMCLLKSRGVSDCTSTGELLVMQCSFGEFGVAIKENLDCWEKEKNGLRATLRGRYLQHRSTRQGDH